MRRWDIVILGGVMTLGGFNQQGSVPISPHAPSIEARPMPELKNPWAPAPEPPKVAPIDPRQVPLSREAPLAPPPGATLFQVETPKSK